MPKIPNLNYVHEVMEHGEKMEYPRSYIGYSSLGDHCKRAIWLGFRWCFVRYVDRRTARIFERGDLEEARIIRDLKQYGDMEVFAVTKDGKEKEIFGQRDEQEEIVHETGHIKGHPDGRVRNVPGASKTTHLLEMKTMNKKYFAALVKAGKNEAAYKKEFPTYYGQTQSYMGRMGLKRALVVITNKDTEERAYIRIHFNEDEYKHLEGIGMDILTSEIPPHRIGDRTWFQCKWCKAKDVCHYDKLPPRTCRSCVSSCIEMDGKWSCELTDEILTLEDQKRGCNSYVMIPAIKDLNE